MEIGCEFVGTEALTFVPSLKVKVTFTLVAVFAFFNEAVRVPPALVPDATTMLFPETDAVARHFETGLHQVTDRVDAVMTHVDELAFEVFAEAATVASGVDCTNVEVVEVVVENFVMFVTTWSSSFEGNT